MRLDRHRGYRCVPVEESAYPYTVILHDYDRFKEQQPEFSEYRITKESFAAIPYQPEQYVEGYLEPIKPKDILLDLRVPAQRIALACIVITLLNKDYENVLLPLGEKESTKPKHGSV